MESMKLDLNIEILEGDVLDAMRFALIATDCFVLSMVEVAPDVDPVEGMRLLVEPALIEMGITPDTFAELLRPRGVQFLNAGYADIKLADFVEFVNGVSREVGMNTKFFLPASERLNEMRLLAAKTPAVLH